MKANEPTFYAILEADPYLLPIIHSALSSHVSKGTCQIIKSPTMLPTQDHPLLQIRPYESLDLDHLLAHPTTSLANSYVIRKALIRKHYLWQTVSSWWVKHPDDQSLRGHVPLTVGFEVDYAEFLDEALLECWEMHESFAKEQREWWVLKPGMSDQGQCVRLFSSEDELRAIFEEWEENEASTDGEEEGEQEDGDPGDSGAGTMTSQLRHFIAQRYINPPLLFPEHGNRKWHIRSYVLVVGALKVYVYEDMLALFAPLPYVPPGQDSGIDPRIHLTNTCLHDGIPSADSVVRFWDLPATCGLTPDWKSRVHAQISAATATLFEAAAREQMIHFQPLPNAFEVFGVDWTVDAKGQAWLLEVNAFPDFKQSGEGLKKLVTDFWVGLLGVTLSDFLEVRNRGWKAESNSGRRDRDDESWGLKKVLDIDLGRR